MWPVLVRYLSVLFVNVFTQLLCSTSRAQAKIANSHGNVFIIITDVKVVQIFTHKSCIGFFIGKGVTFFIMAHLEN